MRLLGFLCVIFYLILSANASWWQDIFDGDKKTDSNAKDAIPREPVIIIPGLEGSQMEAKLNKTYKIHPVCKQRTDDWFNLWANPLEILPEVIDCFKDNFRLRYDNVTRRSNNTPGVQTRIPGFGETDSVEYLTPNFMMHIGFLRYFADFVDHFVEQGYTRGRSIRAAPYDFRKAPNEAEEWLAKFLNLIEETYKLNDQRPVTLVCHSMGCLYSLYFLNQRDQVWKSTYIKQWITIAAPFGGAGKVINTASLGNNFGIMIMKAEYLRDLERSNPSGMFLAPSATVWPENETIFESPTVNFTTKDYPQFFKAINYPEGYEMWKDTKDLVSKLEHPGVHINCLVGDGHPTDLKVVYRESPFVPNFNLSDGYVKQGNGDGTVNDFSLAACKRWDNTDGYSFSHRVFPGEAHTDMVKNTELISHVFDLVQK